MSVVPMQITISAVDSTNKTEDQLALNDIEQVVLAILAENRLLNTTTVSSTTGEPTYTPLYTPPPPAINGPICAILVVSPRSIFKTITEFEPDYPLCDDAEFHDN